MFSMQVKKHVNQIQQFCRVNEFGIEAFPIQEVPLGKGSKNLQTIFTQTPWVIKAYRARIMDHPVNCSMCWNLPETRAARKRPARPGTSVNTSRT